MTSLAKSVKMDAKSVNLKDALTSGQAKSVETPDTIAELNHLIKRTLKKIQEQYIDVSYLPPRSLLESHLELTLSQTFLSRLPATSNQRIDKHLRCTCFVQQIV